MTKTRICSYCKQEKPTSEFHKRNKPRPGFQSYCKSCKQITGHERSSRPDVKVKNLERGRKMDRREYHRTWRKSEAGKEYRKRVKEKIDADPLKSERSQFRIKFNRLVNSGKLPHISECQCAKCGKPAKHYHHYKGYKEEHILDVVPLCYPCHRAEHGVNVYHQ